MSGSAQPQHAAEAGQQSSQQQQQQQQQQAPPGADGEQRWWLSDDSSDDEQEARGDGSATAGGAEADPLYDPHADDEDERWAAEQRAGGGTSDAHLSCPGCFATLCLQCQQHALYHTQFRALSVMNCVVKTEQVLTAEVEQQQQQQQQTGRRKRRAPGDASGARLEQLHPVCCAVCDTQVGARDADGVVHFFQVLASEP